MIQKSTLDFLKKLKVNNNKEWFEQNRSSYESAKENVLDLVDSCMKKMIKFDNTLAGLEAKKCLYRINRDVRFSKDKLPYKINFGASITKEGRKSLNAGYYIHIQPGNESFIGGGVYMPDSARLKAIRQEIVYNTDDFLKITGSKKFIETFGELWGEKMKTAPRDYPKDHPQIEILKNKHFIYIKDIKDSDVLSPDFDKKIVEAFKVLHPAILFFNHAIEEVK